MTAALILALGLTVNMVIVKAAPTSPAVQKISAQSLQTVNTRFVAEADAYVTSDNPATNFGKSIQLRSDGFPLVISYLRFNVQGLTGSVQRARLRIFANSYSNVGYFVLGVNDNIWEENTITYQNAPSFGNVLGRINAFSGNTWTIIDITPYITGNGSYTLAIIVPGVTAVSFSSRDAKDHAPYLIVTTTDSSTPTAASTDVPIPTTPPVDDSTLTPTDLPVDTGTPAATDVPVSTDTPVPTDIPVSTNTPMPTDTPANTNTPTPMDTPVDTSTPTPTVTSVDTSTPTPVPPPNTSAIQHVFVVVMENHSNGEIWNSNSAPYITSLGSTFARATAYRAVTHPSLPNYLDLFAGSNYSITTDCNPSNSCHSAAANLADSLEARGLSWKGYMESMPSPCYLTGSGNYAPKHNPFVYFDDIRNNSDRCAAHVVPYTGLADDLASASTTPNYAFITPNLCNDMHNCSVATGDTWLKNNLPAILSSPACTVDNCLLALTWDEDDSSQSNQVLTIFAGSAAKTGGATSSAAYTHFSLLRTIENIFGLPTLTNNDAAASPMSDMLR